jgi:hypothetical protein
MASPQIRLRPAAGPAFNVVRPAAAPQAAAAFGPLDFTRYAPEPRVIDYGRDDDMMRGLTVNLAFALWRAGATVLWLYLRYWSAALRLRLRDRAARAARSLAGAYALAGCGWGAFAAMTTIHLIWR